MYDLLLHLQSYGLTPLLCGQEQYEEMLLRRIGEKDYRRLRAFQAVDDRRKDGAWAAEYYDFMGHYSRSGICQSLKTLTLAAHGTNTERVLPREGRILDVGTNLGWLATWYARQSSGRHLVGLDVAQRCIFAAKKKAAELGVGNAEFVAQDFFAWTASEPFDAVVDTQALCDLVEPEAYLGRLRTMVRPHGRFVSVPSRGDSDRLGLYLAKVAAAGFAPQFVGYHAANDFSATEVYPMVVAVADGPPADIDLALLFRRIYAAQCYIKWGILLRAQDGPPEVALFVPSEGENPDLLREGDRPASVNGVAFDDLKAEAFNDVYTRDGKWTLHFDRGGERIEVCYA